MLVSLSCFTVERGKFSSSSPLPFLGEGDRG